MNNKNHIHSLVDKFMTGDTTLLEEQELYRYFSGSDIAEDLLPLRPLFKGIAELPSMYNEDEPKAMNQHKDGHATLIRLLRRWSIAAAVALLFSLGGTAVYRSQNYSEVIVYGHKTNDPALIHHEIASTMQELDMQPENSVKAQLDDVLLGQD